MKTHWLVRAATPLDQAAIVALVRGERLNPRGIEWQRFVVASDGDAVIGAAQMRRHPDGSCELGSLVVAPHRRGEGLAQRLVDALLERHDTRIHVITAAPRAGFFRRWGFQAIEPGGAPGPVRRNHRLGQYGGGLVSLLRGRRPQRLIVMVRP